MRLIKELPSWPGLGVIQWVSPELQYTEPGDQLQHLGLRLSYNTNPVVVCSSEAYEVYWYMVGAVSHPPALE